MSEGTQNIGDEQAVVGEPASHPHQAIVVGEPPEDVAPVLGEPAFANGLQDQQPISPPSVDRTSANGIQSTPLVAFHEESSSHVSAPSSTHPVAESPNLQQVLAAEASESGTGEGVTHQLETPVAETPSPHVDGVSSALTYTETHVAPNNLDPVHSAEEEHIAGIPNVVEVTHIEDCPSAAPSEVLTENPFVALDDGPTADENAPGEIIDGDTPVTDGAPAASASSSADEISSKGLGDQQEESSLSSAVQEKQSTEHLVLAQTDVDDGSKVANEDDVHAAELEKVVQGDALAQESEAKEANLEEEGTGPSVMKHLLAPELDQASERDALVQGYDGSEDVLVESETASREVEHVLSRDVPQSEVSTVELSTSQKDVLKESHAAPIASELPSSEETLVEAALADSCVAPLGTRAIVVEECLVTQPPTEEFPLEANGNNGSQHFEDGDGALEREQDLSKEEDDDASAEAGKPISRIKLPLIFTGLAIAAVGVAVASISRTH